MVETDPVLKQPDEFVAEYTTKDLILYALALGFGSCEERGDEELRFLYEDHPSFTAVPTFCLVLSFWANREQGTSFGMRSFPPFMMKSMGVIPKQLLRVDLPSELPVLHTYQSITWHRPIPLPLIDKNSASTVIDSPVSVTLSGRFVSVVPKRIGTFVTSETDICLRTKDGPVHICTLESTALVLGLEPENVILFHRRKQAGDQRTRSKSPGNRNPDFDWTFDTGSTQALLYRIASGDTNTIHVEPGATSLLGGDVSRPILHGLCTLGIALRAILHFLARRFANPELHIRHLACQFVKPVFVGDGLRVLIWVEQLQQNDDKEKSLLFNVHNAKTEELVVSRGRAEIRLSDAKPQPSSEATSVLKSNL